MRRLALAAAFLAVACSDGGDDTPPAPPVVLSPAQGATLGAASLVGGQVVFSGTAEAGATVRVDVDGSAAGTAVADSNGAWSAAATVASGVHSVVAVATDGAGNASGPSAAVTFTLDAVPPDAPAVVVPGNGARLDASELVAGQVVVSGTAEAGATVAIAIDGAAAGSGVAAPDGRWSITATVAAGPHTVRARATDGVGNASGESAASAFTLYSARLASALPAGTPVTSSWAQTLADTAGFGEVFPGQANTWVLGTDFALLEGFGQQYHSALALFTGTPTAMTHAALLQDVAPGGGLQGFPADQTLGGATFLTPAFGAQDGVVTAAASDGSVMGVLALSGSVSGFLAGTADSRLARTLSLAAGEDYTLAWTDAVVLDAGLFPDGSAAPFAPAYQVVVRDPATGAVLATPFAAAETSSGNHAVALTGLPATVVLSFELRSGALGFAEIDDVALSGPSGPVELANGDFEAGTLAGWTANGGAQAQNVRSAARAVGSGASALSVTRTVYAPPAATWARVVDVFENTGTAAVTTSAVYLTTVTAPAPHVVASAPGTLVAWDPDRTVRDVGVVSGAGIPVVEDGSPHAFAVHDLSVPAGGKVALAHFVVQLGGADGGPTAADVPAQLAAECDAIAAGFPDVEAYALDLEPGVLGLVRNF